MPSHHKRIATLQDFQQRTPEFLQVLKETGEPVVLTEDDKAVLVVQDIGSYLELLEGAERAERWEALRSSIHEMKQGEGIPADEVLAEIRKELDRISSTPTDREKRLKALDELAAQAQELDMGY